MPGPGTATRYISVTVLATGPPHANPNPLAATPEEAPGRIYRRAARRANRKNKMGGGTHGGRRGLLGRPHCWPPGDVRRRLFGQQRRPRAEAARVAAVQPRRVERAARVLRLRRQRGVGRQQVERAGPGRVAAAVVRGSVPHGGGRAVPPAALASLTRGSRLMATMEYRRHRGGAAQLPPCCRASSRPATLMRGAAMRGRCVTGAPRHRREGAMRC